MVRLDRPKVQHLGQVFAATVCVTKLFDLYFPCLFGQLATVDLRGSPSHLDDIVTNLCLEPQDFQHQVFNLLWLEMNRKKVLNSVPLLRRLQTLEQGSTATSLKLGESIDMLVRTRILAQVNIKALHVVMKLLLVSILFWG